MKKIIILSLTMILFSCINLSYGQSKYFNFLRSKAVQIDEKYTKLEIIELDSIKYILTRDTLTNGSFTFTYTPQTDVFNGLKERYEFCDKELEKIEIEIETLKKNRKIFLEKKARLEFLMSQE